MIHFGMHEIKEKPEPKDKWACETLDYEEELIQGHDVAGILALKLLKTQWGNDWEVFSPNSNQLTLDYDCESVPDRFYELLPIMQKRFGGKAIRFEIFDSRHGNKHVIVSLPEGVSTIERIAWQAILGSDPKREALTIHKYNSGVLNPSVLFMKKNRRAFITYLPEVKEAT